MYRPTQQDQLQIHAAARNGGHAFNAVDVGVPVAMVVVRADGERVNGRLQLDGDGPAYWVQNVDRGPLIGQWDWPERVAEDRVK